MRGSCRFRRAANDRVALGAGTRWRWRQTLQPVIATSQRSGEGAHQEDEQPVDEVRVPSREHSAGDRGETGFVDLVSPEVQQRPS